MQLTTLTFLGLATSSLAAVLPRSQLGSWAVSYTHSAWANGYSSVTVSAKYTSDSYPNGINSTCKEVYDPTSTPRETSSCDNDAFEYEYDGETIKLQQVVELPTKATVFGSAPLGLKSDEVGRNFSGNTTVVVTEAIA